MYRANTELNRYTRRNIGMCILAILIGLLIGIISLRSKQEVIVEKRAISFSYENLEEIEDIKPIEKPSEPEYEITFVEDEIVALCQMIAGESANCGKLEMSCTVWAVLNRVDNWNRTILDVITESGQFTGYSPNNKVTHEARMLVIDVLTRWQLEKQGADASTVGRTLPREYMWWNGNAYGTSNIFRDAYDGYYHIWDFSLPNPYDS